MTSPKQLARLLAVVPYLLARPRTPLDELADTFGVTVEQMRKDLELVWMCGLPGHFPGDLIEVDWEGDTVTLSNADTIARPLRLRGDEAAALLVGLRTLAEVPGLDAHDAISRALAKVETAAGEAAHRSAVVAVDVETNPDVLAAVTDALDRGRALDLTYYVPMRDERTERVVDPIRLHIAAGRTYLEAWCRRVEDMRLFRLDRVLALTVLDEPSTPPAEAEPRDLSEGIFRPSAEDELVVLDLDDRARWVAEYYPCESIERREGGLRVTIRTPDTRWVARLALRLGGALVVVAPEALSAAIRAEAEAALRQYSTH